MKLRHFLVLCGLCYAGWAQAEIYKRIDADGHVTYSSTPLKGAKKLHLAPLSTMPPPPPQPRAQSNEESADFPRVDAATQKDRDSTRKQILEDELAAEEKALAEARADMQEGADSPGTGAGKSARQERVQMHEKNIEALKTELANRNK